MKIKIEIYEEDEFARCTVCTSEGNVKTIKLANIDDFGHESGQAIKMCESCRGKLKAVL